MVTSYSLLPLILVLAPLGEAFLLVQPNQQSKASTVSLSSSTSIIMQQLDDSNMRELLYNPIDRKKAVLIDSYAPWCGPVSTSATKFCISRAILSLFAYAYYYLYSVN